MERHETWGGVLKRQVPVIGGVRKVIKDGGNPASPGTTISEFGSGTVSLATLAALITQLQSQQVNTGGGNIGTGNEGTLVLGPGLSGGGVLIGNIPLRLSAPIPWGMGDDGGGGDGDPGPPGLAGIRGINGATGGVGPAGPAIFMAADEGQDGDSIPGGIGPAGASGNPGAAGPTGPAGTTLVYVNTTIPAGNTVANTSVETFFTSSYVVPANSLAIGTVLRVRFFGIYSTGVVAPSLTLRVYFGTTVLITSGTLTTVANITNDGWSAEGLFTVQGIGSLGTIEAQGLSEFSTASTVALFVNMDNAVPITVDTTINETLRASIQWGGTVNASDTITLREMTVELMTVAGIPVSLPPIPPFVFFGDDGAEGDMGPPGLAGASGTGGGIALPSALNIQNLQYWFDASQVKANANSYISILQNSNSLFSAMSPAWVTAGTGQVSNTQLNGKNVAALSGSSGYLMAGNAGPLLSKATMFAVFNASTVSGTQAVISGGNSCLAFSVISGAMAIINQFVAVLVSSSAIVTANTWFQVNATFDASTGAYAFRIAEAAAGSGSVSPPSITASSTAIGYTPGAGQSFPGSIAEIIIYDRVLTGGEISAIEAYLLAKWGV